MRIYVIQVIGGRERTGAELLRRHAADAIEECFLPAFELMRRKDGAWRKVRELLFPGYLFVKTTDPERLAAHLRRVPVFTAYSSAPFVSITCLYQANESLRERLKVPFPQSSAST